MARAGGWYKSWDDELEDPKLEELHEELSDAEFDEVYRVWRTCLNLCNRSPARLRERGFLFHSEGNPVSVVYIARKMGKPVEAVQKGLERLCAAGGPAAPLLAIDTKGEKPVIRVPAWRKRQARTADELPGSSPKAPRKLPGSSPTDVDGHGDGGRRRRRKTEKGPPRATWPAERAALRAIDGYPFDDEQDQELMDILAVAYTQLDLAQELRKLHAWLAAQGRLPLQGQRGPRQRVRNWMRKADEFANAGQAGTGSGRGKDVVSAWRSGRKAR